MGRRTYDDEFKEEALHYILECHTLRSVEDLFSSPPLRSYGEGPGVRLLCQFSGNSIVDVLNKYFLA